MKHVNGRDWLCTRCGAEARKDDQGSLCFDVDYFNDDDDGKIDGVPVGCAACGGPYPHCTTSCPMFDD